MDDPIVVLWNPSAGSVTAAQAFRAELDRHAQVVVEEPASREETMEIARKAAREGAIVVAAGGDGTLNAVVNGLIDVSSPRLAVLPLGTANDFSFTLGLPDDPAAAFRLIEAGVFRELDVIRVEVEFGEARAHCMNVATGGNSDRITECLTPEVKQSWGPLCYLRGAVEVLSDLIVFDTQIQLDDQPPERFEALNVIVANGRTSGGRLHVAPRANPEDGLLDVVVVLDGPPLDLVSLGAEFFLSDYLSHPQVVFRQARQIHVDANPPLSFALDGEPFADTVLRFTALPKVAQVVVGPQYHANTGDLG